TSIALRTALARNPYLKVFVAMGYYDMATPYFAAHYTLHHISLDPTLLRNISTSYYEAGHMMYIDEKSLSKLRADVEKFMQDSTGRKQMTTTIEHPDGRVELRDVSSVSSSPIYNEDLAPVPIAKRNWTTYNYAALWISMAHCI